MGIVIFLLLLILAIFLIRIPIIIANARGVGGGNLKVIAILSWCGLFFGITWIIALILALVYQSQVNITNTTNGQVVYLSRNNEEHLTAYNRNVQTPILSNLDKLEKLATLKEKGIITEQEYEVEKHNLLNS